MTSLSISRVTSAIQRRPRTQAPPVPKERATARAMLPPLTPRLQLLRGFALMAVTLSGAFLVQLIVVSGVQQAASQQRAFDVFRSELAKGVTPIGPVDIDGNELDMGSPVARIEVPSLGIDEIIVEGTTSSELLSGPGHLRSTVLPGQVGLSAIFGRRASYGGPFSKIGELSGGDLIRVTTGQGTFDFTVLGVRREGSPLPDAQQAGTSRLLLVTADGPAFVPSGLLRVDADLAGQAVGGPARLRGIAELEPAELAMATDHRTLWVFVLWLQALLVLSVLAVWAWHRLGPAKAWAMGFPPIAFVGLSTAGELVRLLPNLL